MTNTPQELPPTPDVNDIQGDLTDEKETLEYDPETATYRAAFENRSESVCLAVVSVVGAISTTHPTELPSLQGVVDCDALDALVSVPASDPSCGDVHVTFDYDGHEVTVYSYGIVSVQSGGRGQVNGRADGSQNR